jgi:signal transduction histidine kinase
VGLPDRDALRAALEGKEGARERTAGGEPVRLLTVPVAHDGRVVGAVQVVKTLRESRGALSRTLATLLLTGAAGLLLSAVGSWFLAGRAMRPIEASMDRQRRFIADASHELRTPVAVLRARAELLQRDAGALPDAAREEVARLQRDAEEMSELLGELLDLARLDAADEKVELEPIAIADVAEEVASQLAPLAEERSVTLSAKVAPVWARAHLSRARQVLRALGDNAIKHTPPGGHVVIGVAREGDRVEITVADDGEGIAPEHLPRVFDRFYRADAARSRGEGVTRRGSGLGLAIAAELVRSMSGEITIDSAPARGTTVTVFLPLAPAA